ncbi:hypothetical protein FRB91_010833 [Serendipita sp. 411]|nr:hypothetical protein FRC19_009984 [Serendipita sp. 401]KAG8848394.1 hypothetical protein FRB91_010833 [Serendipita sp. 411]
MDSLTGFRTNPHFREEFTPPNSRPSGPLEHSIQTLEPSRPISSPKNAALFPYHAYTDEALLVLGLHKEGRTSFITCWPTDMLKYLNIAIRLISQIAYEKAAPLNIQPPTTTTTREFMLWCGMSTNDAGESGP